MTTVIITKQCFVCPVPELANDHDKYWLLAVHFRPFLPLRELGPCCYQKWLAWCPSSVSHFPAGAPANLLYQAPCKKDQAIIWNRAYVSVKGYFYVSETVNIHFNGGIQILKSKSAGIYWIEAERSSHYFDPNFNYKHLKGLLRFIALRVGWFLRVLIPVPWKCSKRLGITPLLTAPEKTVLWSFVHRCVYCAVSWFCRWRQYTNRNIFRELLNNCFEVLGAQLQFSVHVVLDEFNEFKLGAWKCRQKPDDFFKMKSYILFIWLRDEWFFSIVSRAYKWAIKSTEQCNAMNISLN